MKFIVDAQLPGSLAEMLSSKGFDALHTLELPDKNRTSDEEIMKISKETSRVVITKDSDFLESFIINQEPPKLIFVTTGNISNDELLNLFDLNLARIIDLLSNNSVIELSRYHIVIHY